MTLAFLLPAGLAALFALSLPIVIHLRRSAERRVVDFAALRWLAGPARPRLRLLLERPWLLVLRLLLVALAALLLAAPVLRDWRRGPREVVLVAAGVDPAAAPAAATATRLWLAPGFPALDTPLPASDASTSSLLREIDADLPDDARIRVVVPAQLGRLDAARIALRHAVEWQVVPGASPDPTPTDTAHVRVAVRYDAAHAAALPYLRAAVAAWNAQPPGRCELDAQPANAALAPDTRWLVWLADPPGATIDAWVRAGGTLLRASASAGGADGVVAHAQGAGRVVELDRDFTPSALPALLDATFPAQLKTWLENPPPPARADAASVAPLRVDAAPTPAAYSPEPWLALAIAALFVLERLVAQRTPREAVA